MAERTWHPNFAHNLMVYQLIYQKITHDPRNPTLSGKHTHLIYAHNDKEACSAAQAFLSRRRPHFKALSLRKGKRVVRFSDSDKFS